MGDVKSNSQRPSNRLIHEKSPYLLQHAHNPIDWYPWSEEAFKKAKEEDKPIFLSIGYSTCHWCHVMERESFEDEEVAELMNEVFVSIKVDREERPDIDKTYMQVAQMMTGRGGWPLTIIMTPEKEPFFAATYIPKKSRYNQPGMLDLIPQIKEMWEKKSGEISRVITQVKEAISSRPSEKGIAKLDRATIDDAFHIYSQRFDEDNGGFGRAPKFPSPHNLIFLLRYWRRTDDPWSLHMVQRTLDAMRLGGIFDHIGYGFHRYSTDAEWLLPHFEKMLYDQAMHILAYSEAYQATKHHDYADVVHNVIEYLRRDMMDNEGAFYSAEDADSEGEEGKYYVWTTKEIQESLTEQEAELFMKSYNIKEEGNFRDEATRKRTGANIPHLTNDEEKVANELGIDYDTYVSLMERIREKLLESREERVRPHLDDKILTDWNGLIIAALAKASRVLGVPHYLDYAEGAMKFILQKLRPNNKELLHRYRDGEASIPAFLDDYAFLVWGLIELYESSFNPDYLRHAIELSDEMIEKFLDTEEGGFYFSSHSSEELLSRNKDAYDGAMPSGNSAAALNLVRLSRLTGKEEYEEIANDTLKSFSITISNSGAGFSWMLTVLDYLMGPSYEVVIAGDESDPQTGDMIDALRDLYLPTKVLIYKSGGDVDDQIAELAPYAEYYDIVNGEATAHVCINHNCKLPTNSISKMIKLLEENEA